MWLLLLSQTGWATWSIVAADPQTGQVGGAGASCVGDLGVEVIFGAAPGLGALHAQARLSVEGRDAGADLLADGATPQEVINALSASDFDLQASERQYGVVTLAGEAAAWTGSTNGDWAGDQQGAADGIVYSAQGNILTGAPVVSRTAEAFEDSTACDLAERLVVSLRAGRAAGEGDSRCTDRGVPADSAFVRVVNEDGVMLVDLSVTNTGNDDPLDALDAQLAAWRLDNPCPEAAPDPALEDTATNSENTAACGGGGAAGVVGFAVLLGLRRRGH